MIVHAAGGPVRGVVGRLPTHIVPEAERGKAAPIKEQFVDIGAHDHAEALSRVAVGDPVTFDQGFSELTPGASRRSPSMTAPASTPSSAASSSMRDRRKGASHGRLVGTRRDHVDGRKGSRSPPAP